MRSPFNLGVGSCDSPECDCIHLLVFLNGALLASIPMTETEWGDLSLVAAKAQFDVRKKLGGRHDG